MSVYNTMCPVRDVILVGLCGGVSMSGVRLEWPV